MRVKKERTVCNAEIEGPVPQATVASSNNNDQQRQEMAEADAAYKERRDLFNL